MACLQILALLLFATCSVLSIRDDEFMRFVDMKINISLADSEHFVIYTDGVPGGLPPFLDIKPQKHIFRFQLEPKVDGQKRCLHLGAIGMAINGVPIYRAYSQTQRDVTGRGRDLCNGQVDIQGAYNYKKDPVCLENEGHGFIGVAKDGFPIYRMYNIDGLLLTAKEQNLDECNGKIVNGEYHYYITSDFPYILGCFHGVVAAQLAAFCLEKPKSQTDIIFTHDDEAGNQDNQQDQSEEQKDEDKGRGQGDIRRGPVPGGDSTGLEDHHHEYVPNEENDQGDDHHEHPHTHPEGNVPHPVGGDDHHHHPHSHADDDPDVIRDNESVEPEEPKEPKEQTEERKDAEADNEDEDEDRYSEEEKKDENEENDGQGSEKEEVSEEWRHGKGSGRWRDKWEGLSKEVGDADSNGDNNDEGKGKGDGYWADKSKDDDKPDDGDNDDKSGDVASQEPDDGDNGDKSGDVASQEPDDSKDDDDQHRGQGHPMGGLDHHVHAHTHTDDDDSNAGVDHHHHAHDDELGVMGGEDHHHHGHEHEEDVPVAAQRGGKKDDTKEESKEEHKDMSGDDYHRERETMGKEGRRRYKKRQPDRKQDRMRAKDESQASSSSSSESESVRQSEESLGHHRHTHKHHDVSESDPASDEDDNHHRDAPASTESSESEPKTSSDEKKGYSEEEGRSGEAGQYRVRGHPMGGLAHHSHAHTHTDDDESNVGVDHHHHAHEHKEDPPTSEEGNGGQPAARTDIEGGEDHHHHAHKHEEDPPLSGEGSNSEDTPEERGGREGHRGETGDPRGQEHHRHRN